MKKIAASGMVFAIIMLLTQCVTTEQRWPDYQSRAEDKMAAIQQKIGNATSRGEITPSRSHELLTQLDAEKRDYNDLRDRWSTREEWQALLGRLDALERNVDRSLGTTVRAGETGLEERILTLQKRIDQDRISGRLGEMQGRELQVRLDAIRSDFSRVPVSPAERDEVAQRLNLLDSDITRAEGVR